MKMSLRKGVLLLWALCFGTGINRAYAGEVLQLTLDEALKIALSDNPTIKVADQDIELKKVSAKEAWQSLLPTVDLNGTITYTIKTATMNIGGNQVPVVIASGLTALQEVNPQFQPDYIYTGRTLPEQRESCAYIVDADSWTGEANTYPAFRPSNEDEEPLFLKIMQCHLPAPQTDF